VEWSAAGYVHASRWRAHRWRVVRHAAGRLRYAFRTDQAFRLSFRNATYCIGWVCVSALLCMNSRESDWNSVEGNRNADLSPLVRIHAHAPQIPAAVVQFRQSARPYCCHCLMEKGMGPSIAHLPGQGPHEEAVSLGPARSSGVFDRPFVKPWPMESNTCLEEEVGCASKYFSRTSIFGSSMPSPPMNAPRRTNAHSARDTHHDWVRDTNTTPDSAPLPAGSVQTHHLC
jgi:hypothetical protein